MARWLAIGFLALLAAIGSVRSARADDVHYEDFRFGQRAMGMAGAVVGFLTEPEASYYNPGGLGFSGEATFSGSLHFFGVDKRIIRDGMYLPIPGGKQEYGGLG